MDAVIALTERGPFFNERQVFVHIQIDQSLALGYSEALSSVQNDFEARGYHG